MNKEESKQKFDKNLDTLFADASSIILLVNMIIMSIIVFL